MDQGRETPGSGVHVSEDKVHMKEVDEHFSGSTVLHSETSSLCEASISQFLTRFSTSVSRESAVWSDRLPVAGEC